jgi:hypothetical protein
MSEEVVHASSWNDPAVVKAVQEGKPVEVFGAVYSPDEVRQLLKARENYYQSQQPRPTAEAETKTHISIHDYDDQRRLERTLAPAPAYRAPDPDTVAKAQEEKWKAYEQMVKEWKETGKWDSYVKALNQAQSATSDLEHVANIPKAIDLISTIAKVAEKIPFIGWPLKTAASVVENGPKIADQLYWTAKAIQYYNSPNPPPEDVDKAIAAAKQTGQFLMGAGATGAALAEATGIGTPAAILLGGLSVAGHYLASHVAMGLEMKERDYKKEKKMEEADKLKKLKDKYTTLLYSINDYENIARTYQYAKQFDNAASVYQKALNMILDAEKELESEKDEWPDLESYNMTMNSLKAKENVLRASIAALQGDNPARYAINAGINGNKALHLAAKSIDDYYAKRRTINLDDPDEAAMYEKVAKRKADIVANARLFGEGAREVTRYYRSYSYQPSKLARRKKTKKDEDEIRGMVMTIARSLRPEVKDEEEAVEVTGLPKTVLDYPVIAKLLAFIMYNPNTPLAILPNSAWNANMGENYTPFQRYLMLQALEKAKVSPAEVANLTEKELEAILRFRQYVYAAIKRGYFLPYEFELYTRAKELLLLDDNMVAEIMRSEIPTEVRNKLYGEKIFESGVTSYITPEEVKVEVGSE